MIDTHVIPFKVNPAYINGLMYLAIKEKSNPTTVISDIFITKVKYEYNINLEIKFGINNQIAGYFITDIDHNKRLFIQDVYMEDKSSENIDKAINWFHYHMKVLKKQLKKEKNK